MKTNMKISQMVTRMMGENEDENLFKKYDVNRKKKKNDISQWSMYFPGEYALFVIKIIY